MVPRTTHHRISHHHQKIMIISPPPWPPPPPPLSPTIQTPSNNTPPIKTHPTIAIRRYFNIVALDFRQSAWYSNGGPPTPLALLTMKCQPPPSSTLWGYYGVGRVRSAAQTGGISSGDNNFNHLGLSEARIWLVLCRWGCQLPMLLLHYK